MRTIHGDTPPGSERHRRRRRRTVPVVAVLLGALLVAFVPVATAQELDNPGVGDPAEWLTLAPTDPIVEDTVIPDVLVPATAGLAPIGNSLPQLWTTHPTVVPPPLARNYWVPAPVRNNVTWGIAGILSTLSGESMGYQIQAAGGGPNYEQHTYIIYVPGAVGVPQPIDLSGNGVYDFAVEVRNVRTTPTLRVTRLPGSPSPLDVWLEVTTYPFGRDAPPQNDITVIAEDLPAMTKVTVTDPGWDSGQLAATVKTINPADSLGVAVTYRLGADYSNQITASEFRSPVPDEFTFGT